MLKSDTPQLDPWALEQILALDPSGDVFSELALAFSLQLQEQMTKLRTYVTTKDFDKLRASSHLLKSSGAYLGAIKFSELCRDLESQSAAKSETSFELAAQVIEESISVEQLLQAEIQRIKNKAS